MTFTPFNCTLLLFLKGLYMQRIIIIGCPGSGKSRLSKILAKRLNLPLVHLDKLFWKPNWEEVSKEHFDKLLVEELKKPSWILDGNFSRTLELRLKYADGVILLNYPALTCVLRVLKRVIKNRGKTREDMTEGCNERLDIPFLKYVRSFKRTRLPQMKKVLNQSNVPVIEIKNDRELKRFINSLPNKE